MADLVPVQVKSEPGKIADNLDAVEISIREKTREYSTVVVTEDTIKDGKKFLADIRKEKQALDDQRKAIKSQWMEPYNAFEKRAKKIIALYDEPVKAINDQLDAFEETRREEKRKAIRAAYDSVKGELEDWLPLERVYNARWENATYDMKKVQEDLQNAFTQIQISIDSVKALESEFEADAMETLKKTGSLQDALQTISSLKAQKERFEAAAREKAEREMREAREREEQEAQEKAIQDAQERDEQESRERDLQATAEAQDMDSMPFAVEEGDEPEEDEKPFDVDTDFSDFEMESVEIHIRFRDHEKLMALLATADFEWKVVL